MKVNRQQLLKCLESIVPGISTKLPMKQSDCAVFRHNTVSSFNDEISVSANSPVDMEIAVYIQPLISILSKITEEEIDVSVVDGNFKIKGNRKRLNISADTEIELPLNSVEIPNTWKSLPNKFIEYMSIVRECVSKDESEFLITCVHITSEHVEACDNDQALRYNIKTDVKTSFLLLGGSVKYICRKDIIEFSETKNWVHFRNKDGLVISCRRYVHDSEENEYPELDNLFIVSGEAILLPKEIKETCERANVLTKEDKEQNMVKVTLKEGKIYIRGENDIASFSEWLPIEYSGEIVSFFIPPSLLISVVERKNNCVLGKNKISVTGDNYIYVSSISVPEEK